RIVGAGGRHPAGNAVRGLLPLIGEAACCRGARSADKGRAAGAEGGLVREGARYGDAFAGHGKGKLDVRTVAVRSAIVRGRVVVRIPELAAGCCRAGRREPELLGKLAFNASSPAAGLNKD